MQRSSSCVNLLRLLLLLGVCPYHSMDPRLLLSLGVCPHPSMDPRLLPVLSPSACQYTLPRSGYCYSQDQVLVIVWLRSSQVSLPRVHSLYLHHMSFISVWVTLLHQSKHTPHIFTSTYIHNEYSSVCWILFRMHLPYIHVWDLLQALQVPLDHVLVKHPIHDIDMWIMLFKTQAQAKMTQGFSVDA